MNFKMHNMILVVYLVQEGRYCRGHSISSLLVLECTPRCPTIVGVTIWSYEVASFLIYRVYDYVTQAT